MQKESLNSMLSAQIHCADNCIQKALNRSFGELGLTTQQAMVMAYLEIADAEEKVNQRRIQEFLQISNPSVVSLVNSLEKKNLLARESDPDDGRNTLLVLTQDGKAKAAEVVPMLKETEQMITGMLTAREAMSLQKILVKLLAKLNK